MAFSEEYLNYILDQFSRFGEVQPRKMFGGAGLYFQGIMFALIADDALYLKVDKSNRVEFEQAGSEPFKPYPDKPASLSYYQVPVDIPMDITASGRCINQGNHLYYLLKYHGTRLLIIPVPFRWVW